MIYTCNYFIYYICNANAFAMRERILEFLNSQNKTSSQFAEEIGVEPSGISHIISGRNKPSLDFVLKMLGRYPFISSDWLLFGRGNMFSRPAEPSLFDTEKDESRSQASEISGPVVKPLNNLPRDIKPNDNDIKISEDSSQSSSKSRLKRIIWFYED